MPRVVANGVTLHYQQAGQGPDLVLIHGIAGDLSGWFLKVMPALADEFRVTAYDLRGHGYSDVPASGYTSFELAADLRGLLECLGIERAHLLGHSYGGAVALQCAALYPSRVASLVLAEPWIAALMPLVDLRNWPHLDSARIKLQERGLVIPDDRWSDVEFMSRRLPHVTLGGRAPGSGERSGRRRQRLLDTTSALVDAADDAGLTVGRLREVRQPTLALYGEASPLRQLAEHIGAAIPCCQVQILAGVAHYFPFSRPEMLVAAALDFLRPLVRDGAGADREQWGS